MQQKEQENEQMYKIYIPFSTFLFLKMLVGKSSIKCKLFNESINIRYSKTSFQHDMFDFYLSIRHVHNLRFTIVKQLMFDTLNSRKCYNFIIDSCLHFRNTVGYGYGRHYFPDYFTEIVIAGLSSIDSRAHIRSRLRRLR